MANSRLAVAAHITAVLASKGGAFVPSSYVASSVNTNPALIRRILRSLAKAGLVESEKGKTGGSRLARRPEAITLWDVCEALGETHLFRIHQNPANRKCPISLRMKEALGGVFGGAERAARARLKGATVQGILADMGV